MRRQNGVVVLSLVSLVWLAGCAPREQMRFHDAILRLDEEFWQFGAQAENATSIPRQQVLDRLGSPDIEADVASLARMATENGMLDEWLGMVYSQFRKSICCLRPKADSPPSGAARDDDKRFLLSQLLVYDSYLRYERPLIRSVWCAPEDYVGLIAVVSEGKCVAVLPFSMHSYLQSQGFVSYTDLGLIDRHSTNPRAHSAICRCPPVRGVMVTTPNWPRGRAE